ncbi:hypothetical protein K435DRAFT_789097 [Dendrothele bispora CBS 962.96]|uniref:Uncharacterized protein n=1 Tax=Dendrothele bispora (strain CBS 962.96) TaxID=1314807 RepID=A0A4S8MV72_DENBC|nr:hypothetical protein K435DRAFT_789097 [Dendrothele bispora CBS 962.96]
MFNRLSTLVATIALAMAVAKAQCATGSVAECCDTTIDVTTPADPFVEIILRLLGIPASTATGSVGIDCQPGSDCGDPLCCTTAATVNIPILGGLTPVAAGCVPA